MTRLYMPSRDYTDKAIDAHVRGVIEAVAGIGFVAGSAARHQAVADKSIGYEDIDVFLKDGKYLNEAVDRLEFHGWHHVDSTENAYVMRTDNRDISVQLILPRAGRRGLVWDVLNNFDFTVNCFALVQEKEGLRLYYHPDAFAHYEDMRLVFVRDFFPDAPAMIQRIAKYHKKGFSVSPTLTAQVLQSWDKLDAQTKAERIQDQYHRQEVYGSYG